MKESMSLPDLKDSVILVVDDDAAIVTGFTRALRGLGAEVYSADSVASAEEQIRRMPSLHAVLADLKLKDGRGLELLPTYRKLHPGGLFYLITGYASIDGAVDALQSGVRNYFQKPLDPLVLATQLEKDLTTRLRAGTLTQQLQPYLLFRDPVMERALADLPKIAAHDQSTLINGETGTGKELVARAVHGLSRRGEGPFVALNCGAIPETLLEDELFGHEKGAFTGAAQRRYGRFEQAQGGSLFLDEIGEMPLHFQVRLLRALEDRVIQRVGSEQDVKLDVRIIAATHRDLQQAVEAGLFREDLYYRLAILPINLPPLRERLADIELLADHFLQRALQDLERTRQRPVFNDDSLVLLKRYPWPGNVRELRNLMTRLALQLPAEIHQITVEWIEPLLPPIEQPSLIANDNGGVFIPARATLAQAERLLIDAALKHSNNNRTLAARQLGIGERTLRRKLNHR